MASSYELLQRHCVLSASVHRIEISRPAAAIRRGAGGTRSAATPGARRPHAVEHTELSALGPAQELVGIFGGRLAAGRAPQAEIV